MTRHLFRTVGVLVGILALLTSVTTATPAAPADSSAKMVGPPGGLPDPPGGLPDPVPDFVSSISDGIRRFVEGALGGNPGAEVSATAGDGGFR